MKRRVRKIANFFAFNLLFFALYLNFIHKDKLVNTGAPQNVQQTTAFSGTVLVENPEQVIEKKSEVSVAAQQIVPEKVTENNTVALRLSIN
jgi:hypothetical protein